MIYLPFETLTFSTLAIIIYSVNFLIAIAVVFLERKNPSATLAWILVLFFLPILGAVLYFLLSQNFASKKLFELTKYEKEIIQDPLDEQLAAIKNGTFSFINESEVRWKDMIHMHQVYSKAYLTQDNKVQILTDGKHMFESLISDIMEAKEYINIEYFIVKNDNTGRALIDALTMKAQQGVEVRFVVDAMGSRQIGDKLMRRFVRAGGRFSTFFPPNFKYLNIKFNYRNHRKMVVIDGEVGYLGGFNIANEYLGKKKKFGYWRDTHLRLMGSCVQDINARFILDWRMASKEKLVLANAYLERPEPAGNSAIQVVSSGPDSYREEVKHGYLKMISNAKKSIYIQTPYFVPDASIYDSILTAAISGVDVRIMIPCMPDHIFVYWATYYYCGLLIQNGVKVYIYDDGFLHAKTMTVDGEVTSVGSANFDIRSFKLNFEANCFVYDPEEAYKMEAIFEEDMEHCHELTKTLYAKRSFIIKIKEGIAKLLSDIL